MLDVVLLRRALLLFCSVVTRSAKKASRQPIGWAGRRSCGNWTTWPDRPPIGPIGCHSWAPWNICVSTNGVFDLQRRWQRCRSSSLVIVSWQRLIDINGDELGRKEQTHTYLMTGTTHIWSQLTDYYTDVYNVNVAAACEELEAHLIGVTHCWVALDQPRQNCGKIVWMQ